MRHITSLAKPSDGKRILEILECSPAKGSIELLYTRRPDAYLSYQKESDEAYTYVVKDGDEIIGTVAELVRRAYIGGEEKRLAYLCGLKKAADYPHRVNWGKTFIKNLVREDIDCYFCSVVSDNARTLEMFSKRRSRTMNMERLQGYTTYMLAPYFKFKVQGDYTFTQATAADALKIVEFLNQQGRKKDFFPVISSLSDYTDLSVEDFYMLLDGEKIAAVGALWNQVGYRQYIVKRYKGAMKLARLFNPLLRLLGYIELPKEGENLNFPMLSFFISRDDNEDYYKAFLNNIAGEIKRRDYRMFVIGVTNTSAANEVYNRLRSIHFETEINSIEFILGSGKQQQINKESIWLECGFL